MSHHACKYATVQPCPKKTTHRTAAIVSSRYTHGHVFVDAFFALELRVCGTACCAAHSLLVAVMMPSSCSHD